MNLKKLLFIIFLVLVITSTLTISANFKLSDFESSDYKIVRQLPRFGFGGKAINGVEPQPSQINKVEIPELPKSYEIHLKSRKFVPVEGLNKETEEKIDELAINLDRIHVILQFDDMPTRNEKIQLENNGIRLLSYLPDYAWFASIPTTNTREILSMQKVRTLNNILPEDKMASNIREDNFGNWSLNNDGSINLIVKFFSDVSEEEANNILNKYGNILDGPNMINDWRTSITKDDIRLLSEEDTVQWIETTLPPDVGFNDGSRESVGVNIVQGSPYNLDGTNIKVGIWDEGNISKDHDDLQGRVTNLDTYGVSDHATHVAGTLGGSGTLNSNYKGMAPEVNFYSYSFQSGDDEPEEHNVAINTYGIDLSQNSWGTTVLWPACDLHGDYVTKTAKYDNIVTGLYGEKIPVVFAAGNDGEGSLGCSSGYNTLCPPGGTAKNVIVVGSIDSDDDELMGESSRGPTDDGRIKPDVVAPGCQNVPYEYSDKNDPFESIWSTVPTDTYIGMCGTSMAAPVVSGVIALMLQEWRKHFVDILPSTLKAILIQTAEDLGNKGPDYTYGYGKINAKKAIDLIKNEASIDLVFEKEIDQNQMDDYYFIVPTLTQEMKITLVWDDEPGTPNADKELVNNLALFLIAPNGTLYRPWILNPDYPANNATRGIDSKNNVEQIEVVNPQSGIWRVAVIGSDQPNKQNYSLVLPFNRIPCTDNDNDGWMSCLGDCDDSKAYVYPGAPELCDSVDNDCDSTVDEGCSCENGQTRTCGPGTEVGECQNGIQTCVNGQWGNCEGAVYPTIEICDTKDNDCDDQTDEGVCGGVNVTLCQYPGYESCYEYSVNGCVVALALNVYSNVNDIRWRIINDSSDPNGDPFVIKEYKIGWYGVDAEEVYYDVNNPNEGGCDYYGCDGEELPLQGTKTTVTAPGTAHYEEVLGYNNTPTYACWFYYFSSDVNYGPDDPIFVLNCFNNTDCPLGQRCDKSGSWQTWQCIPCSVTCSSDSNCPSDSCYSGTYRDYHCTNPGSCDSSCDYNTIVTDNDYDDYDIECDNDCNDNNPAINPGIIEICDNIDNNCNSQIDENLQRDCSEYHYGICASGTETCAEGEWSGCLLPEEELCDNLDNDCDNVVDNHGVCIPPLWKNQGQNNSFPLKGVIIQLYAETLDENGVDYAWLSTNETGVWVNYTNGVYGSPVDMLHSKTWIFSNFTWQNTSVAEGTTVAWRIYYNDTHNNENVTNIKTFSVILPDSTPPLWRGQGQANNTVYIKRKTVLYAEGKDKETALDYTWLSTNETGVWHNKTYMPMNESIGWTFSNFTWQNTSLPEETIVAWKIYYNDTYSNENVTDVMIFEIQEPPPATTHLYLGAKEENTTFTYLSIINVTGYSETPEVSVLTLFEDGKIVNSSERVFDGFFEYDTNFNEYTSPYWSTCRFQDRSGGTDDCCCMNNLCNPPGCTHHASFKFSTQNILSDYGHAANLTGQFPGGWAGTYCANQSHSINDLDQNISLWYFFHKDTGRNGRVEIYFYGGNWTDWNDTESNWTSNFPNSPQDAFDENWETYASTSSASGEWTAYENYTLSYAANNTTKINYYVKHWLFGGLNWMEVNFWNYSNSSWSFVGSGGAGSWVTDFEVYSKDFLQDGKPLMVKIIFHCPQPWTWEELYETRVRYLINGSSYRVAYFQDGDNTYQNKSSYCVLNSTNDTEIRINFNIKDFLSGKYPRCEAMDISEEVIDLIDKFEIRFCMYYYWPGYLMKSQLYFDTISLPQPNMNPIMESRIPQPGRHRYTLLFNETENYAQTSTTYFADVFNMPWSNNKTTLRTLGNVTNFYIDWSETSKDYGIDNVFFESNFSGSPQNYTMKGISGYIYDGTYNYNITASEGTYYWKSYATSPYNGTKGSWNSTWYENDDTEDAWSATSSWVNDPNNAVDENWTRCADTNENDYIWINYTKPAQADGADWKISAMAGSMENVYGYCKNSTGDWYPVHQISGTDRIKNFTKSLPENCIGGVVQLYIHVNSCSLCEEMLNWTSKGHIYTPPIPTQWSSTPEWIFTISESPIWRNVGQENAVIQSGRNNTLYAEVFDKAGIDYAWLETNETGNWAEALYVGVKNMNDSSGTWVWSNFSWQNIFIKQNSTVAWRIVYNDTGGNISITDVKTFSIVEPSEYFGTLLASHPPSWQILLKPGETKSIPSEIVTWITGSLADNWLKLNMSGCFMTDYNFTNERKTNTQEIEEIGSQDARNHWCFAPESSPLVVWGGHVNFPLNEWRNPCIGSGDYFNVWTLYSNQHVAFGGSYTYNITPISVAIKNIGQSVNNINKGEVISLYAKAYNPNVGVDYAWLSTNETGVWVNYTNGVYGSPVDMLHSKTWIFSNFTWQNTSVAEGTTVAWKIYYNDTYGYENTHPIQNFIILTGDANDDCTVDMLDLIILGNAYGSTLGKPNWDGRADLKKDNIINIFDLSMIGKNYGGSCL